MRKLLFQSLFRPPFTEQAPAPDDAAVNELASAVGNAARRRLGRSLSVREVDARCCKGCWRCSNGSTQPPLRLENRCDLISALALRQCRELGATTLNSPSPFEGSRG